MYTRSRTSWIKHIDFMLLDMLCLAAAFFAAFAHRFSINTFTAEYRLLLAVLIFSQIISTLFLNNLSGVVRRGWYVEMVSVILQCMSIAAFTSLFLFAAHIAAKYSRLQLFNTIFFYCIADYLVRCSYKRIVRLFLAGRSKTSSGPHTLIYTNADGAEKIVSDIQSDIYSNYNLCGIVLADGSAEPGQSVSGLPVASSADDAAAYICREWIDEVFVYLPGLASQPTDFVSRCAEMGVTVHTVLNIREVDRKKQFVERLGGNTVLTTAFNYVSPYQAFIKRTFDIIGGLVGCALTGIIGIFIAPAIYIASPGPVIFKQRRIGKNGRQFFVYKFRSMYLDAEERKKELVTDNLVSDGMMFKIRFDPRVIGNRVLPDGTQKTGIGEFIRCSSLDEFPQFFNVLKGDMSLVGTRPPTVDEWEKYEYHHRARLAVRPGITGLWQVSGRSEITDFEEVVRLDTEYICNFRISQDIKILLKTFVVLLKRKGAM